MGRDLEVIPGGSMRIVRRPSALALLMLGVVAASCGKDRDAYIASGDRYVQAEKYIEAIIEYRNAVRKDPLSGPARLKLADAYMQAHDPADAADEFKKASEL